MRGVCQLESILAKWLAPISARETGLPCRDEQRTLLISRPMPRGWRSHNLLAVRTGASLEQHERTPSPDCRGSSRIMHLLAKGSPASIVFIIQGEGRVRLTAAGPTARTDGTRSRAQGHQIRYFYRSLWCGRSCCASKKPHRDRHSFASPYERATEPSGERGGTPNERLRQARPGCPAGLGGSRHLSRRQRGYQCQI
jgi:hypothetical protein